MTRLMKLLEVLLISEPVLETALSTFAAFRLKAVVLVPSRSLPVYCGSKMMQPLPSSVVIF